jgi:hypothetical protein
MKGKQNSVVTKYNKKSRLQMLTVHGKGLQNKSFAVVQRASTITGSRCNVKLKRQVQRLQGTRNCTVIMARAVTHAPPERNPPDRHLGW